VLSGCSRGCARWVGLCTRLSLLHAGAVVRQFADAVEQEIDKLPPNRVVAACVVVGRVLLSRDELLRVVELPVGARAHLREVRGRHCARVYVCMYVCMYINPSSSRRDEHCGL
jgi:hypothetical protein